MRQVGLRDCSSGRLLGVDRARTRLRNTTAMRRSSARKSRTSASRSVCAVHTCRDVTLGQLRVSRGYAEGSAGRESTFPIDAFVICVVITRFAFTAFEAVISK